MLKPKTPWLAAALNFVLPGAGYVYVGTRLRFGVLLIAAMVIALFAPAPEESTEVTQATLESYIQDPSFVAVMISALLIAGAFAYDAWCDARDYNQALEQTESEPEDL